MHDDTPDMIEGLKLTAIAIGFAALTASLVIAGATLTGQAQTHDAIVRVSTTH